MDPAFPALLAAFGALMIVLYSICVRYGDTDVEASDSGFQVTEDYEMFIHVSIMIFIGFGFLMTFLKRHGYTAVGLNFVLSCAAFLWDVLCAGFWLNVYNRSSSFTIRLNMPLLTEGLFGAAAVMISFGAVIGRLSPSQLVAMMFLEIMMYSLNLYIGLRVLGVWDAGGSMIIHVFGAYFGLAFSWKLNRLTKRQPMRSVGGPDNMAANGARTTSDITAMIGTLFLWIMWPSFNAVGSTPDGRLRAISNTLLALLGAVIATFVLSIALSHHFDMVTIQNSTLAGGVAMGTAADLFVEPAGALGIGAFAGLLSVFGYKYITPWLERRVGLLDTCGVHNLHGMPGVLAGIASIIVVASTNNQFGFSFPYNQPAVQLYTLLHTLGVSIVTGLISASLVCNFLPDSATLPGKAYFEDAHTWEVQPDYHSIRLAPVATRMSTAAPTPNDVIPIGVGDIPSPKLFSPERKSHPAATYVRVGSSRVTPAVLEEVDM